MSEKKPCIHDVAVLIIFFVRDKQLKQVFEQVKKARPSKLYLYQDGARDSNDLNGIARCREIVCDKQIDWECQVSRMYSDENRGCDPSEYIAQKWMFEHEEMGIILEDDDVPSQSFFPFCTELLHRYKDNPRINMICGMNSNDITENVNESYFFTKHGSIWGWASWRRVLDTWDPSYKWLDMPEACAIVREQIGNGRAYNTFIKTAAIHRSSGRAHYESINAAAMFLDNRINIVPKYNMIKNIGIDENTTHSVSDIRLLTKETQKLINKKTYDISFPLIHPTEIKINTEFDKTFATSRWHNFCQRVEGLMRRIRYTGIHKTLQHLIKKVKRRS